MNNLFYFAEPITDKTILHLPLIPAIVLCILLILIFNKILKDKYSLSFITLSCIYVFLLIDIIFYPFISHAQAGTFIHDPQYTFSLIDPITTFISNPLWSFYQLVLFIPLGFIFMSIFKNIHKSIFYFIIIFIVIILTQIGINYYTNYLQYTISVGKILLNLFSFGIGILLTNILKKSQ